MNITKPKKIIQVGVNLAIKWDDDTESFLPNKKLREACPCAHCSGETDVFGNIYKGNQGEEKGGVVKKYEIMRYINIGHYAIRIVWGDGHNAGIYSFSFLKTLDDTK